jgi:5-methylcytosine-specific restriction endonuclease McrA
MHCETFYMIRTLRWQRIRIRCGEAQGWRCCFCHRICWESSFGETGERGAMATGEHITPRSKGGKYTYNNATMSCKKCNLERGVMNAETFYVKKQSLLRYQERQRLEKRAKLKAKKEAYIARKFGNGSGQYQVAS